MALDKDIGSVSLQGIGKRGTVVSNAAQVEAAVGIANTGFDIFESVAKSSLKKEVESIFEDVPEFQGLEEDEFATASISGGPTATVTTQDSPVLARMVADVRSKQRAVDQGVRSPQWYQAQVNKIVAEYTDMAPGLAREFASVAASAENTGISKIADKLAQEEIYQEQREQMIQQGEKYNIDRVMWDSDPLGAAALLQVRANIAGQAATSANLLQIEQDRGTLNKLKATELFKKSLPHINKSVGELLEQTMGLLPGASGQAVAKALTNRGPEAAVSLQQDWQTMKVQLYSRFNARGQGIDQATFDAHMAPMDQMVTTAVSVLNGEATDEALKRVVSIHKNLSENLLIDTEKERQMVALTTVLRGMPPSVLTDSKVLEISETLGYYIENNKPDFSKPDVGPGAGGIIEVFNHSEGAEQEAIEALGGVLGTMFEQLAEDPSRVHVQVWDNITKAIKNPNFWDRVDALPQETRQGIYDDFNSAILERAVTNDAEAALQNATRNPFSSGTKGTIVRDAGFNSVRDVIQISTSYPPVATPRPGIPDNMGRVARDEANKFNQHIARRLVASAELRAEFLKRTGDTTANPAKAYRELYQGRIANAYRRQDEAPKLDKAGADYWRDNAASLSPLIQSGDNDAIARYMDETGAPDSFRDVAGL